MTAVRRLRIWLLTNVPSPYQMELLGRVSCQAKCDLDVRFMSGQLPENTAPGAERKFIRMRAIGFSRNRDECRLHLQALRECRTEDWDTYVLSGTWASPTLLMCARILTRRKKKWLLWCERPHPDRRIANWSSRSLTSGPLRFVRNRVMQWLMNSATGMLAIGSAAVREYQKLGMPPERILSLPYCCDVNRFAHPDAERLREIRNQPELRGRVVILFSGQLIERKGLRVLAEVFLELAQSGRQAALLILGDGPMRGWLEQQLSPVADRVVFAGRRPQGELPSWFGASDVFFFPSRHDGWAVVINEACGAGLPIVTSTSTGAAFDLVQSGVNGFIADRDDVVNFRQHLAALIENPVLRQEMGQRSSEIVSQFAIEPSALRWFEAVTRLSENELR